MIAERKSRPRPRRRQPSGPFAKRLRWWRGFTVNVVAWQHRAGDVYSITIRDLLRDEVDRLAGPYVWDAAVTSKEN